ncbi:MAG TPA: cation:proton antiporter [Anaerolineales bacterium]|nr:cation:proton antiporter [Anaerolineales bacterium]
MTTFLQLAFLLSIILLSAKLAGYLSVRLGQPSVLGELLVGILLGPSVIDVLNLPFIDHALADTVAELGELGVLLLMFIAGLELHLDELTRNTRVAAYGGFLGVLVPTALGWGAGRLFGMDNATAIFLGLTLGATSVSISAQTLMELKVLRSRVGLSLLGAAVFDDILVILSLSIFLAVESGMGSLSGVAWILVKMIIFLALSVAFGLWGLPWLVRRIVHLPISQGVLTLALVVMLAYGLAAELLGGMAAITGAFIAGLMMARSGERERVEHGVHALAYGLFVPVFFINIGLSVNARSLQTGMLWFTLAIILTAIIGKWLGAGIGARLGGLSLRESVQLGAGMVSRGEVGLIVASVGINEGLVRSDEFSAIVAMVLATTLVTPPILRSLFARKEQKARKPSPEAKQATAPADPPNEEAA